MIQSILVSINYKKFKPILITAVLALSILAAPLGAFGTQKASAAQGDWGTQWVVTRDRARNLCYSRGWCYDVSFVRAIDYGSDSRRFTWKVQWTDRTQCVNYYIGNSYYIWSTEPGSC